MYSEVRLGEDEGVVKMSQNWSKAEEKCKRGRTGLAGEQGAGSQRMHTC